MKKIKVAIEIEEEDDGATTNITTKKIIVSGDAKKEEITEEPKKIMIVDDEPSISRLVASILTKEGYEVETLSSGMVCLNKLKNGANPDLLILDMLMPHMSGREVLTKIRQDLRMKKLKVLFLTVAKFSETGQSTLARLNVVDYITKPFDNTDLIKRIQKAISS